ncbi:MAG: tRNA (adenosine(37)-N6)-dimethylallyltransferase MiaA [Rhodobacteraceae bacterium]|nr:tRNA (adenosine(37)-N6)-dimethylallyltransferase MiaA [Paracoccaceae bacterium]
MPDPPKRRRAVAGIPDCSAVLIAGPTASGKSALALEIASARNGIIINADSMQVYSCWQVLTARPGAEEIKRVPHALYGHVSATESYSVGAWLRDIADVLRGNAGRLPVIVGGTGLYFTALTEGLAPIPPIEAEIRATGQELLTRHGKAGLLARLRRDDPGTYAVIDHDNGARLLRAWEVLEATGRGLSDWQSDHAPPLLPLDTTYPILLCPDRKLLEERIEQRLQAMIASGALQECVASLSRMHLELYSSRAHGNAALIAYLQGRMTLAGAMRRALTETRQYAKRQRTWFRSRMRGWNRIDGW